MPIKTSIQHKVPLLRKASKTFLISSVIILLVSAGALYFYSRIILTHEIEEELYSDKNRIERFLERNQDLKGVPPVMLIEKVIAPEEERISDTLLYDPLQNEVEPFRQLSGTKKIGSQYYRITVRAMSIESEDILLPIGLMFMVIFFLAFIFQFYLIKSRNRSLWKPFFANLEKLKNFSLQSNQPLEFEESDIVEFEELTKKIQALTIKVQSDYQNLKQFTEDISHEIQTPLAIMQAKIENLINSENINEQEFEKFSSLQNDIQRLKHLNKRLILLAKIDNQQFQRTNSINIREIFSKSITNFEQLTDAQIIEEHHASPIVFMDEELANVLISNLLSNALKYHHKNTPIFLRYSNNKIEIINSGKKNLEKPAELFDRFYREGSKRGSTGLGLSIVKKICDYYGFQASYTFQKNGSQKKLGKHIFTIRFND